MKNNKQLMVKNVCAILFIVIFSLIAGYGIISTQKTYVANEYQKSIEANSIRYSTYLNENKNIILQNVEDYVLDAENEDTEVFDRFKYVARFEYNELSMKRTLSIKEGVDESYQQYITIEDSLDLLNKPFGFISIKNFIVDSNDYISEPVLYFSQQKEGMDHYAYILFMTAEDFFADANKYGFDDAFLFSETSLKLGNGSITSYALAGDLIGKDKLKILNSGDFLYATDFDSVYDEDVYLVTKVSEQSFITFVNKVKSTVTIIFILYVIVIMLAVLLVLLSYAKVNKFLKGFKIDDKNTFVVYTDEFGNVLKANANFSKRFAITNIFNQENIDDNFVRLNVNDSLYLKFADREGNEKLINFLCSKTGDVYKLVGVETRNLARYFMHEFGIADSSFEMDTLKDTYQELTSGKFDKIQIMALSITNIDELNKLPGSEKVKEQQKNIAKILKLAFKDLGTYASDENIIDGVLLVNEPNKVKQLEDKPLDKVKEIVSRCDFGIKDYSPNIKVGFAIVTKDNILEFDDVVDNAKREMSVVDYGEVEKVAEQTKQSKEEKDNTQSTDLSNESVEQTSERASEDTKEENN